MLKSLDATLNTPDPANQVIQAYLKSRGAGLKQNSAGLRPSRNWVWDPWHRASDFEEGPP